MKSELEQQKKWETLFLLVVILLMVLSLSQSAFSQPRDRVAGNMMLINDNAGWCWYQDDKIIYDPSAGNIITSTSGCDLGFGGVSGETRSNDVDATAFNIATGKRTRVLMAERGGDDHNMGGLWIRPDGRYLHLYAPHYSYSGLTYYRLATNPHDGSTWDSEQNYDWDTISGISGGTLTYTNLHYITGEGTGSGRLYNIVRWNTATPNISYSDDWGITWQYMGRLNSPIGGQTYSNYYHKFRSNGVDRIDFIGVEQHPRDNNNSVYHGYIKDGKGYDSYGNVVDDNLYDTDAPSIQAYTPIFVTSTPDADTYHTGWTNELEIDEDGYPVCLYQTRYGTEPWGSSSGSWGNTGAADHRFFYARFDGSSWTSTELGKMGTGLHEPEQDYIGMGCIHPDDVNIIYISTPFDPRDDSPLAHHEIFKGVTSDKGLTWDWTQITIDSSEDNIRPAIPPWDADNTAVFWERGTFPQQGHYDMVMVGTVEEKDATLGLVTYIDADESNTEESGGSPFDPTGPSGSAGAADGKWHEYTGYGNGGSCFTAGDGGTENIPTIKTTITGLSDGTYDVFAYFWCDSDLDWGIRGGFESTDMLCFNKQSSQFAEASQFSGSVEVANGDYILYRVYIGRKQISGGGSIDVYLDNYDSTYNTNAPTRTTYDGVGVAGVSYVEDLTPPEPNIMTWASLPSATGPMTITMTATTATDSSPPVQYYFECTTDGDANSGWQTDPTYVASDLSPSTLYSFRVKARDSSPAQNETDWSSAESATTEPPDTTPPTPDPLVWASVPAATGQTTITMIATTATDSESPPVEYYFECTTDGSKSSGWQSSASYTASGLTPATEYSFRVKARDSAAALNETSWSSTESATTQEPGEGVEILGSWLTGTTHTKEPGSNRALVVIAHAKAFWGTPTLSTVTYGGQTMTKIADKVQASSSGWWWQTRAYVAAFILDEAGVDAATSSTISASWSGYPSSTSLESVFLEGVNQQDLVGAYATNGVSNAGTITTSALAASSGDMIIDGGTCTETGTYTANNDFTKDIDLGVSNFDGMTGHKPATGAAETPSVTHSTTTNGQALLGFVVQAATGGPVDTTPPSPDPLVWSSYPTATGQTTIAMTATTATDSESPPVEYYFECTNDGTKSSGWQSSSSYTATGLTPDTQYSFRARARDSASSSNVTGWSSTQSATTEAPPPDTTPPTPDPLVWSSVPAATGQTTIAMTATTATDSESPPVEYYFECTTDGSKSSGWQSSSSYTATGLTPGTQYSFRVKARDSAPAQNETGWSSTESATTESPDTTPPTPSPLVWDSVPAATGQTTITMTATTATDSESPPVEYYFECTNDGSKSSSWQTSTSYTASGLTPATEYSFRVKARDSAAALNETGWSSTQSATTQEPGEGVEILGSWLTGTTHTKEPGSNRVLVVIAHAKAFWGTPTLSTVTYGGQTMTKIADKVQASSSGWWWRTRAYVAAFILDEAGVDAATSSTISASWSGYPSSTSLASVFLEGVNQQDLVGAYATNGVSNAGTITTSALATSSGDMVIDGSTCTETGTYTANNDFTKDIDLGVSNFDGMTGHKPATGAAETPSVTHSTTTNGQALLGFVVKSQ